MKAPDKPSHDTFKEPLRQQGQKHKISIGVPTRQRPEMLEQCLRTLTVQAVPDGAELVIVVVENDREPSCGGVIAAVEQQSTIPIEYHVERCIGLASARNALLDAALTNGSDYLAFIDDDELAYPEWISRLYVAVVEHGAVMASGPVGRTFECKDPPAWATQYFGLIGWSVGGWPNVMPDVLPQGTGNMIVDLVAVRETNIEFDTNYDLTGGEDTLFISGLAQACNGKAVYVNDAFVCEVVPKSRIKRSYIFVQTVRIEGNKALMFKERYGGFRSFLGMTYSGVANIVLGGLFCVLTCFISQSFSTRFLMKVAKGIGILAGLIGYRIEMYKKVTGH